MGILILQLIALMVDGLTILSEDVENRDIVYNLLLVLSGILTDKNGKIYMFFLKLNWEFVCLFISLNV